MGDVHLVINTSHKKGHPHNNLFSGYSNSVHQPYKLNYNSEALSHLHGPAGFQNYAAYDHYNYPTTPQYSYNSIYSTTGKYPQTISATTPTYHMDYQQAYPTPSPVYGASSQQYQHAQIAQYPRRQYNQQPMNAVAYPVSNSQMPCAPNLLFGCSPHVQEIPCSSSSAFSGHEQIPFVYPPQSNHPYRSAAADRNSLGSPAGDARINFPSSTTIAPATERAMKQPNTFNSTFLSISEKNSSNIDRNQKNINMNDLMSDTISNVASEQRAHKAIEKISYNETKFDADKISIEPKEQPETITVSSALPVQPAFTYKSHSEETKHQNFDSKSSSMFNNQKAALSENTTSSDTPVVGAPLYYYGPHKDHPLNKNADSNNGLITTPKHLMPGMASQPTHHYSAYAPYHYPSTSYSAAAASSPIQSDNHSNAWI